MNLSIYAKDYEEFVKLNKKRQRLKNIDRTFSAAILALGVFAVGLAIWPAIVWQVSTSKTLGEKVENLPVPQNQVIVQNPSLLAGIQVVKDPDGFTYFTTTNSPAPKGQNPGKRPNQFYISIPKLDIEKALVRVDSLAFQKNLALFPGTAIPGDVGNAFITGHSILPILYDPKNYTAIFTDLPSLEIGDEVIVEVSGQTLKFVVQYTKAVDPKDTSVLAPISLNSRNLTLMTCVPPGINTKRLVVITSLI